MLPETHPLIEAATKPLADNAEQQLAARAMLEENFISEHPATGETLARLRKTGSRRIPALPSILLLLVAAIVLVVAISSQITELRLISGFGYRIPFLKSLDSPILPSGLNPQELLLLGDENHSELRQRELLYESNPENSAYYCEYLTAYVSRHAKLPPGYFETVSRIAPENSFFLYYAAGHIGGASFEKKPTKGGSSPQRYIDGVRVNPLPTEREFIVLDQAAFDEAMSLIARAAALPEFETYGSRMIAARAALFSNETFAKCVMSLYYQFGSASSVIQLRKATDLLCAKAQIVSKKSGKEEFLALVELRNHLLKSFSNNPDSNLVNELVYSVVAAGTAQYFHWSADRLGLQQLSDEYAEQWHALQDEKDQRDIRRKTENVGEIVEERGSILSSQTTPMVMEQVAEPPRLTADDLKPLRHVDHDLASRLGITIAALIIAIICLPVHFFRYHSPRPVRIPAILLSKLLRTSDWGWITLLGIVAPIAAYLAINRLTPLGGREYSLEHFLFLFPSVQLLATLLTLLLAPAVLIRWRLGKRLAPFGIETRPGFIPFAMLLLILVWSVVVYPVVVGVGLSRPVLVAIAFIPVLWCGNVFLNVLLAVIGKPSGRIPRVATTAALLPAYAISIVALCLTLPLFVASEKHWMKQDTLFRIDPDAPDLGAYEYKVAAQKRKEINAILER